MEFINFFNKVKTFVEPSNPFFIINKGAVNSRVADHISGGGVYSVCVCEHVIYRIYLGDWGVELVSAQVLLLKVWDEFKEWTKKNK